MPLLPSSELHNLRNYPLDSSTSSGLEGWHFFLGHLGLGDMAQPVTPQGAQCLESQLRSPGAFCSISVGPVFAHPGRQAWGWGMGEGTMAGPGGSGVPRRETVAS